MLSNLGHFLHSMNIFLFLPLFRYIIYFWESEFSKNRPNFRRLVTTSKQILSQFTSKNLLICIPLLKKFIIDATKVQTISKSNHGVPKNERYKIIPIFVFGRIEDTINCFWNLLTFTYSFDFFQFDRKSADSPYCFCVEFSRIHKIFGSGNVTTDTTTSFEFCFVDVTILKCEKELWTFFMFTLQNHFSKGGVRWLESFLGKIWDKLLKLIQPIWSFFG
jgi:hypothetical protein